MTTKPMHPVVSAILAIEGLTLELLSKAGYQLRKRTHRCVHATCKGMAVPGQARCEHHRQLNSFYAGASHERAELK